MLVEQLLPGNEKLVLDSMDFSSDGLVLTVHSVAAEAECPVCQHRSHHIHDVYLRKPFDLSWAGLVVCIHWLVRRFKCKESECAKITFAEQIPEVAAPYARRTTRLADRQRFTAFITGGEPGKQVLDALANPASADTLLRLIRSAPEKDRPTPRVLGIDDWAKRKGQTYGAILVDLEKHCPVDVLADRTATTLASWLLTHPGVEIISRDRGNEMMKGAGDGAPTAQQVADRWHLMNNLREALARFLESNPVSLRAAAMPDPITADENNVSTLEQTSEAILPECTSPSTKVGQTQQNRREIKQERFEAVKAMLAEGYNQKEIARHLKMDAHTVRRYAERETCPFYPQGRTRVGKIHPYVMYLEEQWQTDQQNATQLWREIQSQGFSGSRSLIAQWAAKRRSSSQPKSIPEAQPGYPPQPMIASSKAVWLLLKKSDEMEADERAALDRMVKADAQTALAYTLGQQFFEIVRERQASRLDEWIKQSLVSKISALKTFARGLQKDLKAVKAALSLEWSNGQTEGQVNRLKVLKRQMYGRAKDDLLRKRVLGWNLPQIT